MRVKSFIIRIKRVNYLHVLAVTFLALVFIIGAAALPPTLRNFANFLSADQTSATVKLQTLESSVKRDYSDMLSFNGYHLINKGSYINLNGLMARLMRQRNVNGVVKLDNGHLDVFTYTIEDITPAVVQVTKLFDMQTARGGDFLFVLAPFQIPKYENILPAGYTDFYNDYADDLLDLLRRNGVPTLDLRDELYNDGMSHADAFFITDHHWKPEAGFWAFTKIIGYFVKAGILDPIDAKYTDINDYNVEIYKDWFLGTAGKRTGSYFGGVDDFAIIYPKYETYLSLEVASASINKSGNFYDVFFDMSGNRHDFFSYNPYILYTYSGVDDFVRYRNENAPLNKKIMGIGDSYQCVTYPFLSLVLDSVDTNDMRHYKGDFLEYYQAYDPDIVIILVNPHNLLTLNTTYDFLGELQD